MLRIVVILIFIVFIMYLIIYIDKSKKNKNYIKNEISYSQENFENIEGTFKLGLGNLSEMKRLTGEINENIYLLNTLKKNKFNTKKDLREEKKLIIEFQCLRAIYEVSSKVRIIILEGEKISMNSNDKSLEVIVNQSESLLYGYNMSLLNIDSTGNYLPRLISKKDYEQLKENLKQSILLTQSQISMNN